MHFPLEHMNSLGPHVVDLGAEKMTDAKGITWNDHSARNRIGKFLLPKIAILSLKALPKNTVGCISSQLTSSQTLAFGERGKFKYLVKKLTWEPKLSNRKKRLGRNRTRASLMEWELINTDPFVALILNFVRLVWTLWTGQGPWSRLLTQLAICEWFVVRFRSESSCATTKMLDLDHFTKCFGGKIRSTCKKQSRATYHIEVRCL